MRRSSFYAPRRIGRAEAAEQISQNEQILDPERAPPGGDRHERVDRPDIRPACRKPVHIAVDVEEEHPVLTPRPAPKREVELVTHQRMERMSHPHPKSATRRTECTRRVCPRAAWKEKSVGSVAVTSCRSRASTRSLS